jgi:hypothetical protein
VYAHGAIKIIITSKRVYENRTTLDSDAEIEAGTFVRGLSVNFGPLIPPDVITRSFKVKGISYSLGATGDNCVTICRGIFIMEQAGAPFRKLFFRKKQARTWFQNPFFMALVL